jgi:hypothetical protein
LALKDIETQGAHTDARQPVDAFGVAD